MKISTLNACKLIQNIAENAMSGKDWRNPDPQWVAVFEIAHQASAPKCRKNHPNWSRHFKGKLY